MKRLTLIAIPLLLTTAACGGSDGDDKTESPAKESTSKSSPTPKPTPSEPQTLKAATALAKENADRFAAQDYAGSWELFSSTAKNAIPKDAYVEYAEACDLGGGKLNIEDVRLDSQTEATVRYEYMGYTQARFPRLRGRSLASQGR